MRTTKVDSILLDFLKRDGRNAVSVWESSVPPFLPKVGIASCWSLITILPHSESGLA
jgi:hypothetical protein